MEVKDYEKKSLWIILIISIFMTFVPYIYAATVVDSGTCGDNATMVAQQQWNADQSAVQVKFMTDMAKMPSNLGMI